MDAPLNASALQAGALISKSRFAIPQFQREYSWQDGEVSEFWSDLSSNVEAGDYFLGLVILTEENGAKNVVDGQQRLVTLTLLATVLFFEAKKLGRKALADRIEADFLRSIDYDTDEKKPRVFLSDPDDNKTFQTILDTGSRPDADLFEDTVSYRMVKSFEYLKRRLREDLKSDAFKRLGKWADFLTNQLYFAVFIHPDAASAYTVFEVVNTRGRELTTADLLKNFVLSQTPAGERENRYHQWRLISGNFSSEASGSTFVQYIRHAVTVEYGHVLPKDLYGFLSRKNPEGKSPPSPPELLDLLSKRLPLYLQIEDPSVSGPAEGRALNMFSALNSLNVLTVRPIVMALFELDDAEEGMDYLLRLVVRRIVVGNLGTGNIERRFSEAAKKIWETKDWTALSKDLSDLNPSKEDFVSQLAKRSYPKRTLAFMRQSVLQGTVRPNSDGVLHWIWPKNTETWPGLTDQNAFWAPTSGNSLLTNVPTRPPRASENWEGFKAEMLQHAVSQDEAEELRSYENWNVKTIEEMGSKFARLAGELWY
ncbi:DUF262 domain-containing protein [uncultured Ruegeria sp.]|uniref:DUF262 domain-containing protein n=1 Tax=uncultured Ruegeria sp. TaxID=259304 RepID=UPI002626A492|nr:DUF262 domain-containing protein [uncultured Ruegeria sp.]